MLDMIDSLSAGNMDLYDMAMDFDDLAFMNMILCMEEADHALSSRLQDIRALNEQKRSLSEQIAELNELLANAGKKSVVMIEGGLPGYESEAQGHAVENTIRPDPTDPTMVVVEAPAKDTINYPYTKDQVKAYIDKLRGQLEELNTSSSVMLVDLNRLMGKRQEAVQLTSNILSRSHETAMSLIANLGR